ncbi:hypothetical protein V2J09_023154 [Rumex salicifolius]
MEVPLNSKELWEIVLEEFKIAQKKEIDPFLWAVKLSSNLGSAGITLPSIELAHSLVSYICWENNLPISWKFLEKAMGINLVPPVLVLALLSNRIIPCRNSKPAAYRLYMELLKRHAFHFKTHVSGSNYENVMTSVGQVLDLSNTFGIPEITNQPGIYWVGFVFATVWQLLDASLDDEGWLELAQEKKSIWITRDQEMDVDCCDNYDDKIFEHLDRLRNLNTIMAVELVGQFFQSNTTSRILCLAHKSMPKYWDQFIQRIKLLGANSLALRSSKTISPEILYKFVSDSCNEISRECRTKSLEQLHVNGSLASFSGLCHGVSPSSLWIPLDIILEDAMIGPHVTPASAVEIIIGVLRILQAVNSSTWHDTFLALWIAALRIVQRERDPIEGPMPRLASRMCMLLSITTLVVADLIDEEENPLDELDCNSTNHYKEVTVTGNRRQALVSSLQMLRNYISLLDPPQSVVSAANLAAAKAMIAISGINVGSEYFECMNLEDLPSGNMLHLIVEACITRNLIDSSAYFWPGYVDTKANKIPNLLPSEAPPGWSSFMKGAPLALNMINSMVAVPASSLGELEKISELAIKGSDDERFYAATILCGASLLQGWNVQEHTLYFITRLLSPPVPADYARGESHLITYAPMLNALLVGIDSVDCVQIFSLHGLVPHLAASLMAICEVFGSCLPNLTWKLPTGEEISAHAVFSNAFAELLKLWRFNHPPLEYGVGDVPPIGSQLTPEYLLLARNCHLPSSGNFQKNRNKRRLSAVACSLSPDPIFLDQFPNLKFWYQQHRACIASTLSGLVGGTPVHQLVDVLLNMFFKKDNKGGAKSVNSIVSGSSNSSEQTSDDNSLRPNLPAWVIMEAVPFVVDAALTACAHEQLSPRELATGLKNLADFLPASIATIVSYFSAEVTRGVWKPVLMNGTDWPSPKANLSNVEEQIRKILAATGVDVPRIAAGGSYAATLPLPLAAFVSLTIIYKIDKASERFLHLAGPCMESLAAGCPWPCLPIVTSLWTQKARRWTDFLTFSASRTVFLHNNGAVVQLLKSCFATTLGLGSTTGVVGPLLGHGVGSHVNGGTSPVAPGILYLRVYRSIRDIMFLPEEIVSLLMQSVQEIAGNWFSKGRQEKLRKTKLGLRYSQVSLATAMTRIKVASSLAATLIWLSGGPDLVQCLIKETLPSWFISVHRSGPEDDDSSSGNISVFGGFALAYFALLCVAFAWGVDPTSACSSRRRMKVLGSHMGFLASALDGKISFGCDEVVWRVYVSGFLSLMVACTPSWVVEVDVDVLKRLSRGLRQMSEEELAVALLASGGIGSMGAAAELIILSER